MRGCLSFLVFVSLLLGALAFGFTRFALPALVSAAIESSPLLHGQPATVTTETSLAGVVLGGRIDEIRITTDHLDEPNASIDWVDLTLRDVSMLDRSFASASGELGGVSLDLGDDEPVLIPSIHVGGSATSLSATLDFDAAEAEYVFRSRLTSAGIPIDAVRLGVGQVEVTVRGQIVVASVRLADGGVVLDGGPTVGAIPLLEAPAGGEWRVEEVGVLPTGLHLVVSISLR